MTPRTAPDSAVPDGAPGPGAPVRVLHATDASSSGVLAAATAIAKATAALPGFDVAFAYVPRADSPSREEIAAMMDGHVRVIRLSRSHRTAVPAFAVGILALLARRRVDLVHLHSSRAGMLGRAAALVTGHRSRAVYSPHSFAFDRSDASASSVAVLRGLEQIGAVLGPRLALVSGSEERLARRSLRGVRTAVLRNSVDAAALARPASRRTGHGPLRIVHVGRVAPQKRPDVFGEIARRWEQERRTGDSALPVARFRWLGDGERQLLGEGVEVTGWLSPARLRAELAEADLMLFTSAGEGMPIALLEAQAMGIPCVAHPVTGVTDILVDGENGVLDGTADGLFRALASLAADAPARRRMGEAATARITQEFDLADLAKRTLDAYRALGVRPPLDTRVPGAGEAAEHVEDATGAPPAPRPDTAHEEGVRS
ncbi:glycosyltransferase family 4 protein [Brachybacterium sp. MASK1Z-5]|uniref:D-inositol 3-phosphate glycosyltransferase n=1 Tax=Brachybacterium halotolerans TaxID=2795215 RepID=A0ABS1BE96_9MICO|nr:glycosyltransferase family 4 protein [Brachybacterium halotolerans]MBK0332472.1 glycosyltransferase family 4 protein [Brachybacterium halotolerans]MBK0332996.1 glycosyltransferase family 4 protein [Brachybacterium halotolerans]